MTNAEFIRSMPDDKLAKFLIGLQEEQARQVYVMMSHYAENLQFRDDNGEMLEWLRQETEG